MLILKRTDCPSWGKLHGNGPTTADLSPTHILRSVYSIWLTHPGLSFMHVISKNMVLGRVPLFLAIYQTRHRLQLGVHIVAQRQCSTKIRAKVGLMSENKAFITVVMRASLTRMSEHPGLRPSHATFPVNMEDGQGTSGLISMPTPARTVLVATLCTRFTLPKHNPISSTCR